MHMTVRMAWHDSGWNGCICEKPDDNCFCVGTHSLLADRIAKGRDLHDEIDRAGNDICIEQAEWNTENESNIKALKKYDKFVPPCYWSINAFGKKEIKIRQRHAFLEDGCESIETILFPYSFFTWPFKLSFIHSREKYELHGKYPANLEDRISRFIDKFEEKETIIFFYANYDNPVSADDMKYLVLGCSSLKGDIDKTHFNIGKKTLREWRSEPGYKNFPEINWSLQASHNSDDCVLLPYNDYIRFAKQNDSGEKYLNDIKVIVEEDALVNSFKYVCMDMDDDKCLYLLYKIRMAIKCIQEHENAVVKSNLEEEERKINSLIERVWKKRGRYPSLKHVIAHYMDWYPEGAHGMSNALIEYSYGQQDLFQLLMQIFESGDMAEIPDALEMADCDIHEWLDEIDSIEDLKDIITLSMFQLTKHQVDKILDEPKLINNLHENPYVLYEEYKPDAVDLDDDDLNDEAIELFKVDLAMMPDKKYIRPWHKSIQRFSPTCKERLRAAIVSHLVKIKDYGHCYESLPVLLKALRNYPLIHKDDLKINEEHLTSPDTLSHFLEKLHVAETSANYFYYLHDLKMAEKKINESIINLIDRDNHPSNIKFDDYINDSSRTLSEKIRNFDSEQFLLERTQLFRNILQKSLYILTGSPGSGKTHEMSKIISILDNSGESLEVLTPTGKASLRINLMVSKSISQTIDKFIFSKKYQYLFENLSAIDFLDEGQKIVLDNLILDEASMIDVEKLYVLLSIINVKKLKRLIIVGDENQLPPIGAGKPFHDIVQYCMKYKYENYIFLNTNCRVEFDSKILHLSQGFSDDKAMREKSMSILLNQMPEQPDDRLHIQTWDSYANLKSLIYQNLEDLSKQQDAEAFRLAGKNKIQKFNMLLGLAPNGNVDKVNKVDKLQFLSPYRRDCLFLNNIIRSEYRSHDKGLFCHGDKIIRASNLYKNNSLVLANGSIGFVEHSSKWRKYYFAEHCFNYKDLDEKEDFDLAYAITIHKAQGSDFDCVHLIIPDRQALLSRELLYTALTRVRDRLFIYIHDDCIDKLYSLGSDLEKRNTSIFKEPITKEGRYLPDKNNPGLKVKSKIEYIIYQKLSQYKLDFLYERKLEMPNHSFNIHPDFTIEINNKTYYWEHLGMPEVRKYYKSWQERKVFYRELGIFDNLITTDDMNGVDESKIERLIEDLKKDKLMITKNNNFSNHHYCLY